MEDIENSI